jgi:ribosomal protein L37AE/L43A
MSGQQQLRLTIPQSAAPKRFAAECDYCGKPALVRWSGSTVVCDKCLGVVAEGEGESELEGARR